MKLIKVKFPPTMGYQSGKEYTYAAEEWQLDDITKVKMWALVVTPSRDEPVVTEVTAVMDYTPQSFKVKHVLSVITQTDVKDCRALPAV